MNMTPLAFHNNVAHDYEETVPTLRSTARAGKKGAVNKV